MLSNTRPEMKVNCQEIFAPVATVEAYDDFSEALRQVNNSPYGLQAGIFTRDAKLLFNAFEDLDVGGVIAGDVPTFRIDHMPYGGVKESGLGREGLRYAIEEMTEPKLLVMNLRAMPATLIERSSRSTSTPMRPVRVMPTIATPAVCEMLKSRAGAPVSCGLPRCPRSISTDAASQPSADARIVRNEPRPIT